MKALFLSVSIAAAMLLIAPVPAQAEVCGCLVQIGGQWYCTQAGPSGSCPSGIPVRVESSPRLDSDPGSVGSDGSGDELIAPTLQSGDLRGSLEPIDIPALRTEDGRACPVEEPTPAT